MRGTLRTISARSALPGIDTGASNLTEIFSGRKMLDLGVLQDAFLSGSVQEWRAAIPSSTLGSSTNGLLFRQHLICVSTVYSSSKVSLMLCITCFRCLFTLLTATFHKPWKCGACAGINFHLMHTSE